MVPGYNTDFRYRGRTFHVQTEDNGVANPVIVSLLYHKGAILASRKTSYRELLGNPGCVEQLKGMMKAQHTSLMRELLAGAYDAKLPAAEAQAGTATPAAAPASTPTVPAPRSGEQRHGNAGAATLDEGIMRHLEEHAAAAAAAR